MGVSDHQAAWDGLTHGAPGRLTADWRTGETPAPRQAQGRWNWALGTGPSPAHTWGGRQGRGVGVVKIRVQWLSPSPPSREEGLRDWILLNWLGALGQGVFTSESQLSHL